MTPSKQVVYVDTGAKEAGQMAYLWLALCAAPFISFITWEIIK